MDFYFDWKISLVNISNLAISMAILLLVQYNLFYKKLRRRIGKIEEDIASINDILHSNACGGSDGQKPDSADSD